MKRWFIGLLNAGISGTAVAAGAGFVGVGFKKAAVMVGISAAVSMGKWMFQHPIPGGEQ